MFRYVSIPFIMAIASPANADLKESGNRVSVCTIKSVTGAGEAGHYLASTGGSLTIVDSLSDATSWELDFMHESYPNYVALIKSPFTQYNPRYIFARYPPDLQEMKPFDPSAYAKWSIRVAGSYCEQRTYSISNANLAMSNLGISLDRRNPEMQHGDTTKWLINCKSM